MSTRFGLIIVGDEILSGKRQDKHLSKFIDILKTRHLQLAWARYVGDDRPQITAALKDVAEAVQAQPGHAHPGKFRGFNCRNVDVHDRIFGELLPANLLKKSLNVLGRSVVM